MQFVRLGVLLVIAGAGSVLRAQDEKKGETSTFRYSIKDAGDSTRGGGELRLVDKDKVGLEVGDVQTQFTEAGKSIVLTAKSQADITLQAGEGSPSKKTTIKPDGSTVTEAFAKGGKQAYKIVDAADGSSKIELFHSGKVQYVITMSANGELSLSSVIAPAAETSQPPATKATSTSKPSPPAVPADLPNLQITPNSPPPAPTN
ncbi:MAG: hypothetical protein R3C05_14535 [Pirellulaceae bacterium]